MVMSENLRIARKILEEEDCTCALVGSGRVIRKYQRGIAPLLELAESGEDLSAFSAADKIVGKAAALLYVRLGVREVYGEVMGEAAERVFAEHACNASCSRLVPHIINRRGDGICPMEMTVTGTDDPETALLLLREKVALLKRQS